MSRPAWGLLLVNLGTPNSTSIPDVRRYLDEFLSDPRVIDINPIARFLLLQLIILRTRPKASAHAYKAIWTERGSPVLWHTVDLCDRVREVIGDDVMVEYAMRYQNPSIASALDRFKAAGVDRVVLLPLFPQYSSAASGSAIEKTFVEAMKRWNVPSIHVVESFFEHPAFLDAFASVARDPIAAFGADRVMMSFHGIPERHVIKSDESAGAHCLRSDSCCATLTPANRNCYRAQCFATARGLADRLDIAPDRYEVTFQSRLGRDPWIKPYTDVRLVELAKSGVKRLAVMCPAFVADCLETIEEIGIRAKADFIAAGGEDLLMVTSLNSTPGWVDAVSRIARENSPPAWQRPALGA
jgi:ferrochelatase